MLVEYLFPLISYSVWSASDLSNLLVCKFHGDVRLFRYQISFTKAKSLVCQQQYTTCWKHRPEKPQSARSRNTDLLFSKCRAFCPEMTGTNWKLWKFGKLQQICGWLLHCRLYNIDTTSLVTFRSSNGKYTKVSKKYYMCPL